MKTIDFDIDPRIMKHAWRFEGRALIPTRRLIRAILFFDPAFDGMFIDLGRYAFGDRLPIMAIAQSIERDPLKPCIIDESIFLRLSEYLDSKYCLAAEIKRAMFSEEIRLRSQFKGIVDDIPSDSLDIAGEGITMFDIMAHMKDKDIHSKATCLSDCVDSWVKEW